MKLELKPLKYAKEALEPEISKQTLEFHHDKHLQAYVNNFNQFIEGSGLENNSLEEVIKSANGPLFNNAAQVWNHEFYFDSLTDKKGQNPLKKTEALINAKWGSVDKFKEEFEKAANSLFGSGWAWLVINSNNELEIMNESNAGNPLPKKAGNFIQFLSEDWIKNPSQQACSCPECTWRSALVCPAVEAAFLQFAGELAYPSEPFHPSENSVRLPGSPGSVSAVMAD